MNHTHSPVIAYLQLSCDCCVDQSSLPASLDARRHQSCKRLNGQSSLLTTQHRHSFYLHSPRSGIAASVTGVDQTAVVLQCLVVSAGTTSIELGLKCDCLNVQLPVLSPPASRYSKVSIATMGSHLVYRTTDIATDLAQRHETAAQIKL